MERNLSITTAAAALLIGTVFAAAQGVQRPGSAEPGAQGQGGTHMAPQQDKGKSPTKRHATRGQGGRRQSPGERQGQSQAKPKSEPKSKAQSKEPRTQGQGQRETPSQHEGQSQQQPGQQPR